MRARIVIVVVGIAAGAALVLLLRQLGFPVDFTIAWLVLLVAGGIVSAQVFSGEEEPSWPPAERAPRVPGSDVSRLAWSINARTGIVGHVLVARVEATLRRRLTTRGLDLDDPADHARIDGLLGDGIRPLLGAPEVRADEIESVLTAIEALEPAADQIPASEENR